MKKVYTVGQPQKCTCIEKQMVEMRKISKDDLLKVKTHLESINDIRYIARDELIEEHDACYKIIYNALNDINQP